MPSSTEPLNVQKPKSSHILRAGRCGKPYVKDIQDLFSTLVVSLQLDTNSRFFKSYPNSFTADDAAANLASLKFSQSSRSNDPSDPSRIITTTTTTTFSMKREIAKGICQHFMDARLIENAVERFNPTFKERGIYQITPKGLHILERFVLLNGIHADHLARVFNTQPICLKVLHLERRPADDEILITPDVIHTIFKSFSGGRSPNYVVDPSEAQRGTAPKSFIENARLPAKYDRLFGVELQDLREGSATGRTLLIQHVFSSTSAIDWLVDFTTCCERIEAAELLAHLVRYALITLHIDRSKGGEKPSQVQVKAPSSELRGTAAPQGEFRYGPKVTYRITGEGRRWSGADLADQPGQDCPSTNSVDASLPVDLSSHAMMIESQARGRQVARAISYPDPIVDEGFSNSFKDATSSTTKLKAILSYSSLRLLFKAFLKSNFCEENLHYWIDVQEFKRRFSTSSTAVGAAGKQQPSSFGASSKKKPSVSTSASVIAIHQEKLVVSALLIFDTYLAAGSPSELNIDHILRGDVITYMEKVVQEAGESTSDQVSVPALRASQVQALLKHYERIAEHIYRLMATDQVPRFIRSEEFLEFTAGQASDEEYQEELALNDGNISKSTLSLQDQEHSASLTASSVISLPS